jgi:Signal transduction histidine kinase
MTDEERDMSLEYIYTEGKRLETMSQKLFDLLYLKNSTVFMEEQDAQELGAETILHMKPILDRKNITITSEFEDGEIYGDAELMKTVFINLLDNARKASEEGSEVFFGGKMVDDAYEFVVKDNGIGISEEDQKKIFDEFFMVDKSRTRKEGGAGLGMSLVAIILEKHGAKIRIESELGKGTAIYTTWPLAPEEEDE